MADKVFPYKKDEPRLKDYAYFKNLFLGDHFTAFNLKVEDEKFNKEYAKLRYVKVNFAGLVSKIIADILFSEPITVKVEDGDQEFVDELLRQNHFGALCYESALSNSYNGDEVFKLRIKDDELLMRSVPPSMYFPEFDNDITTPPIKEELAWVVEVEEANEKITQYLRKEIHTKGLITNELYLLESGTIKERVPFSKIGKNVPDQEDTKIGEVLLRHSPNWKSSDRYFGISDYYDLDTIFFAINNRFTKIDNILDKHSDPILLVPDGILDKNGRVKKNQLGVIEIKEGENNKPEYVVWDASLENAFKQIEHLIEAMFMVSETSPDALGMGKGQSDSGRALKLKLLRTLAKVQRKKIYYDSALKDLIYRAQLLAKAWGIKLNGKTMNGEAVVPEIEWQDGLPIDEYEQVEMETMKIDAGLTSTEEAIMRIEDVDEDTAKDKAKKIRDEKAINMPQPGYDTSNPFKGVNKDAVSNKGGGKRPNNQQGR